ncbi:undecaprenyldiphospho-muramoylpentapeptide beta-N-acetylglucosaminyltransferase [Teichococcus oryzae]|uniref:UDP-N-acetylglucosamine--N-acetylmuramyl-(pentapeptide) pyrophosphoryl-undecaprenol N-acetylglucosamine transferase n=1 Tax=Teichococcus oryzae TaxID=1608942 RepID=A0A5B2TJS1_9PROT|nr:undecaprenyldiphospho-muramoylpentapeptide beta-N-acetylglucosaminyltransferase [Pseudoroseomonas oryzae]KAA2214732.1 undecaprenyldiphospho-muramoylpentapeptide beta-N-acetylglucosaminyltransferase [Pseudoroseomonas oryzae]
MSAPIVIAAGGTGGHFFPAEALAAELLRRGHEIALMTDARSADYASPAFTNAERFVLKGAGLAGRGLKRAALGAMGMAAGTLQARNVLRRLRPRAVVGFGGYPSVAPMLAARSLSGRPVLVLHEQNAVLGRANRLLARGADVLALSFAETSRVPSGTHSEVIGNPVRPALAALAGHGFVVPQGPLRLLVLGGSLGARIFSEVVPAAIALLPAPLRGRLSVVQQCRAEDLPPVRAAYEQLGIPAQLAPFFGDVAGLYDTAHLVIARAGASTIAELACAGRPAILVPLPHAIDDHQSANARALAKFGGAAPMKQSEFTPPALATALERMLNAPEELARAAAAAASLAAPDAASRLADLVLSRAEARRFQEAS